MVHLTQADTIVLRNLDHDIQTKSRPDSERGWDEAGRLQTENATEDVREKQVEEGSKEDDCDDDTTSIELLTKLAEQTTVFTMWDLDQIEKGIRNSLVQPYISWASSIVRYPTDIVFLTHILIYTFTLPLSAARLFYKFSWIHGILHLLFEVWCAGAWTLLMHNHIHNNGLLAKKYAWIDRSFPYLLGPLLGHTWDSYYYHHVKHHHVENNGPGDLSSTIQYQRDSPFDFLMYEARFLALAWIELPIYFFRKRQWITGLKSLSTECSSLCLIFVLARLNFRPALFTFILPLTIMRIAMMVGNWGQHCLVDELDPNCDFRSSITLIDEASNRHCFNDGYHTSHHLNARRHWSKHPVRFLQSKKRYAVEGALTFKNIDYMMVTIKVLQKDYDYLARCLVPMGAQIRMTHQEKMDMLRSKTRKFSAEEIKAKWGKK
ncbi:MAG: hypothetical protein M1818_002971 [Claussenomyces sp. TS43310]|nr:MAG: hypothetical protein M1818_002971 [Claussenomyces sp. TS43310]